MLTTTAIVFLDESKDLPLLEIDVSPLWLTKLDGGLVRVRVKLLNDSAAADDEADAAATSARSSKSREAASSSSLPFENNGKLLFR